jgi:tetratricopeptide (TPR) repeat protein
MGEKALAVARDAVARDPASYEARLMLGFAHFKFNDPQRALECYEAAARLASGDSELHDMRASALQVLGRLDEAFADFDRAIELAPRAPRPRFHRALASLLVGDFGAGWDGYELRRISGDYFKAGPSGIEPWDGRALEGRTLLVRREQGLGDEIMFASMMPELLAAAHRCVLECDPRLRRLFARSFAAATVYGSIPDHSIPHALAGFGIDREIGGGSLARLLRRSPADFPRHSGYLKADPGRVAHWRERLQALGPGLKVGLSWTGGLRVTRRELRSIPLEQLLPVLRAPGARFVSLQYTAAAQAEVAALGERHGIRIEHWQEAIDDYDETAALACALDQVVTVCTSLVHLAGALARPVWVMAPHSPEWRYGFKGESMPWYPTARVFRQPAFGDWRPVIETVAAELSRLAAR